MRVLHLARTPVSGAPKYLSAALHDSALDVQSTSYIIGQVPDGEIYHESARADIIHWHNYIDTNLFKGLMRKKHVIQYHSEPGISGAAIQKIPEQIKQLVICHYHSSLNTYKNATPVRNVLYPMLHEPVNDWRRARDGKIIITSTLSDHVHGCWQDKGVNKHRYVINRVIDHFKGKLNIEYNEISNVSVATSIRAKARSDIVLDECVTPSFHLSSLEGLALQRPTLCWVDDTVLDQLYKVTGTRDNPFMGCYIGYLEDWLVDYIEKGPDQILNDGINSRIWFDKHWNLNTILKHYYDIYESL